jgi:hypothetical protein
MDLLSTIGTAIACSAATSSLAVWLFKQWIAERLKASIQHEFNEKLERFRVELRNSESVRQARWEIKRQACLDALRVVDTYFSHQSWDGIPKAAEPQGNIDVAKARECYNALALSCNSDEVLQQFKRCLGFVEKPIRGDMIVDLRNAIRRELEFGQEIDKDRASAWIGRLSKP